MSLEDLFGKTIDMLRKSGADGWELYFARSKKFVAEAKDGAIDSFEAAGGFGMAARVRVGDRPGFSYCADTSPDAAKLMVESAVAGAKASDPQPDFDFMPAEGAPPSLNIWDDGFESVPREKKFARAIELESAATAFDNRVKRVRAAKYAEGSRIVRIANSKGLDVEARGNGCSVSLMTVAEDGGEAQMGWDYAHSPTWAGLDVEGVAKTAAADAVAMLGAKPIATTKAPVILRHTAAAELLSVLGGSFLGDAIAKGRSMLIGKIGKKIFSDLVDIIDDGLLDGGASTFPFDGEGTNRRTNILARKGTVERCLYDVEWGRKAGAKSTGSSSRGGFSSPPLPGLTNLYIAAGNRPLKDIMKETGRALLVKELMGVHTANPVSGDFSLGAAGAWIENGVESAPVMGVTVAGNVIETFACVDAVGDDLKFVDNVGAPSLRVSCLSISGK